MGLKGKNRFLSNLKNALKSIENAAIESNKKLGEEIIRDSNRMVPVDTGELKESAYVEARGRDVEIGYAAKYAMIQHEDTSLRHPNGGEAKFLQKAINKNSSSFFRRLSNMIRVKTKLGGF